MTHRATLRFYAELKDFLSDDRSPRVKREFDVPGSVKDMIESCGIPHTEVDLIIANGESVGFDYLVQDGDHISVYPVFESFDISPIVKVRPEPLRELDFVADVHLGRLARYLRLLGLDTLYDKRWDDPLLADISARERRVLLTRDVELLKRSAVTHGYCVRSDDPEQQVLEVTRRFHLEERLEPFSRCMDCNGMLAPADRDSVAALVPPRIRDRHYEYRQCRSCGKVYWRGSHHPALSQLVAKVEQLRTTTRV